MLKFYLSIALSVSMSLLNAQQVIGTTGDFFQTDNASLAWTLGEPVSETYTSQDNILTQGFHQGDMTLVYIGEKEEPDTEITVYPNPFADVLNIRFKQGQPSENTMYQIFDLSGKAVVSGRLSDTDSQVNLGRLANAQYLLLIIDTSTNFKETYSVLKTN